MILLNNERQQQIVALLESKGEVQLQQLKEIFPDVSLMTLRRDLISLENSGYLIRTHGGAVSTKKVALISQDEDSYSIRASENVEAKMEIARKALPLVEKGRSIYFDAGSTIMYLAKILPDENYTILTSGINIALELVKRLKTSVVTLGGTVNRHTLSCSGPNALMALDSINIDLAFMASSGFSLDSGFTVSNIYECELKKKIIKRAKKVIMLMDKSKINKDLAFTFANLEDVDIWVCNELPPEDIRREALQNNLTII